MPRPKKTRCVRFLPKVGCFKPQGVPFALLEEIVLSIDEFEALNLADLERKDQEAAANEMGISRPTFQRILSSARKKVTEAIVQGKALTIKGGNFIMATTRKFKCADCGHVWEISFGTGRPVACPSCGSTNFHRDVEQRGPGVGRGLGPCGKGRSSK
ncbi:DUF134 domain-containing protein [Candidatus Oleimmundimicrobium sp.]|uniref:DUF134 domain-containing protein n=1 Tax=Candidatus Oleimmundimicrobium sp. TaxID=3060597 RepID=UPI002725AE0F|nr:DUF134 domain-containing protein [Candidatus Oleimmundimicrobium sp.]MDO8886614.1 DUF134 domain-containing protein [Candidatus Oleimmundimicrobium sp.]